MKWEDLEPGDKIKITKKAAKRWPRWLGKFYSNKILVVDHIEKNTPYTLIYFKIDWEIYNIYIDEITGKYCDLTIFEIVELKED